MINKKMKSMIKKVLGTVLAAAMTMSLSVSAFAGTITVHFNDNADIDVSTTVSTEPLLTAGTHFQGAVLDAILADSDISKDAQGNYEFSMLYGTKATMLDVINTAATAVRANPKYGATNRIDEETGERINGIFVDSLFDKATKNEYSNMGSDGKYYRWDGSYWNIKYQDANGKDYAAAYYPNNEPLEDTPVETIDLTYITDGFDY